jgi:hypothetical protein
MLVRDTNPAFTGGTLTSLLTRRCVELHMEGRPWLEPRDDAGAPTVIGAARIDPIYLT